MSDKSTKPDARIENTEQSREELSQSQSSTTFVIRTLEKRIAELEAENESLSAQVEELRKLLAVDGAHVPEAPYKNWSIDDHKEYAKSLLVNRTLILGMLRKQETENASLRAQAETMQTDLMNAFIAASALADEVKSLRAQVEELKEDV